MKKILKLLLMVATYQLMGNEDLHVNTIYQQIEQDLRNNNNNNVTIAQFLQSSQANRFIQSIYCLSPDAKKLLMQKVEDTPGGDATWVARRNYRAAIIKTGGDVNFLLRSGWNLLGETLLRSDTEGVEFAIEHNASTTIKNVEWYPLCLARTVPIARFLLNHGAREPFINSPKDEFELLSSTFNDRYDPELLALYKNSGFNLQVKNEFNFNLLHELAVMSFYNHFGTGVLAALCTYLKQAGVEAHAVHMRSGKTPIDIIKANPRYYQRPDILRLVSLLEEA